MFLLMRIDLFICGFSTKLTRVFLSSETTEQLSELHVLKPEKQRYPCMPLL